MQGNSGIIRRLADRDDEVRYFGEGGDAACAEAGGDLWWAVGAERGGLAGGGGIWGRGEAGSRGG